MSDHNPCIVLVNLGKKNTYKKMRQFSTRKLTNNAIQQINADLLMTDWTDLHQLTTIMAYKSFNKKLNEIMDKHAPLKTHIVANNKHFKRRMDVMFIDQMFQEML